MTDTRLALRDVRGPLNDLNEKLSGEEGHVWLPALNQFLRKENPWKQGSAGAAVLPDVAKVYPTPFVPSLTWKQRIEACKFDYVDPEIWQYIESFIEIADEDSAELNIGLDRFKRQMTSSGVESFQAQNRKKMISPARFLHLCQKHPDLQRENPIVCTEKVYVGRDGEVRVLFASGDDRERGLSLLYRDVDWLGSCRFPFSCNVS